MCGVWVGESKLIHSVKSQHNGYRDDWEAAGRQEQKCRQRTDLWAQRGKEGAGQIKSLEWTHSLPYVKQVGGKLLYDTGSSSQYSETT